MGSPDELREINFSSGPADSQLRSYTEIFLFGVRKYKTEKSWDVEIAEHTRSGATVSSLCAKANF